MPRGKKTSTEKVVEVITAKITNPDNSLRDITKQTGVNPETVSDILNSEEIEVLTSSDKAKELFDYNLDIINDGARKVAKAIKEMDPKDIREAKEMQAIVETAFKQNQLLSGKPTDIKKSEIDFTNLDPQQLDEYIKGIVG